MIDTDGTIVDAAWEDSHQLTVAWGDGTTSTYDYAAWSIPGTQYQY